MDISSIKKIKWYRQGSAIKHFYCTEAYKAVLQKFGGFNFYDVYKNYGYFDQEKEKIIAQNVLKNYLKDPGTLKKRITNWRKIKKQQLEYLKFDLNYLNSLPDKDFLNLYKKFSHSRLKSWEISVIIEAFDPWGIYFLSQRLGFFNLKISQENISILTSPIQKSYIQEREEEMQSLTLEYKKGKNIDFQYFIFSSDVSFNS